MLKKLTVGCVGLLAVAAIAGAVFWNRVTRLPDWYDERSALVEPAADDPIASGAVGADPAGNDPAAAEIPGFDERIEGGGVSGGTVDRRAGGRSEVRPDGRPPRRARSDRRGDVAGDLRRRAQREGRVVVGEDELNELLHQSLDEHREGRRLRRAAKAVRASIDGDRLEVGVVTNLRDLEANADGEREAAVVRRLASVAPWLKQRDFYFAVRGTPRARDGNLYFGRDVELKVGGVTFDLLDLASRLGVTDEELDEGFELPVSGMRVRDVEMAGGSVVLSLDGG